MEALKARDPVAYEKLITARSKALETMGKFDTGLDELRGELMANPEKMRSLHAAFAGDEPSSEEEDGDHEMITALNPASEAMQNNGDGDQQDEEDDDEYEARMRERRVRGSRGGLLSFDDGPVNLTSMLHGHLDLSIDDDAIGYDNDIFDIISSAKSNPVPPESQKKSS